MSKKHSHDLFPILFNKESLKMSRGFKGIWIPAELWHLDSLSPVEKILLSEIESLDTVKGCFASNKYFAKFMHMSEGSIRNILGGLRKKGWIRNASFDGRNRSIKINRELWTVVKEMYTKEILSEADCIKKCGQPALKNAGRVHNKMTKKKSKNQKESGKQDISENSISAITKYYNKDNKKSYRSEQAPRRHLTFNKSIVNDNDTLLPVKKTKKSHPTNVSKLLTTKKGQRALQIANKLLLALQHNRWVNWTPNLNKWIEPIIQLRNADLVPIKFKEMEIAISFLKEHGQEYHCPVIRNAMHFASKFSQIEDAIKRTTGQLKPDPVKNQQNIHDDTKPNQSNLLEGAHCQKCKRSDVDVFAVIKPGSFNENVNVCAKCFRKLEKENE